MPDLRDGAGHAVDAVHRLDRQVVDRLLEQPEVWLVLETMADGRLVENAIGLRARGTHGRSLRPVEDAELDARLVGGCRHRAAQCIDLLDQVALADAADRRIAAHLAQRFDVVRQQQRGAAHAGGGERGLGTGMAAADHDDVEFLGVDHRQLTAHDPSHRGRIEKGTRAATHRAIKADRAARRRMGEAGILGGLAQARHLRGQSVHAARPARLIELCRSSRSHLPTGLRRLLHRAVHHEPDPRHAQRQTRRRPLRSTRRRSALPPLRPSRAPGLLRRPATVPRDVRRKHRPCHALAQRPRIRHSPCLNDKCRVSAGTRYAAYR